MALWLISLMLNFSSNPYRHFNIIKALPFYQGNESFGFNIAKVLR